MQDFTEDRDKVAEQIAQLKRQISTEATVQVEDPSATSARGLAALVTALAYHEGEYAVYQTVRSAVQRDKTADEIRATLLEILARGADDTWSGRNNDVRRARFDGIREGVSSVMWSLQP